MFDRYYDGRAKSLAVVDQVLELALNYEKLQIFVHNMLSVEMDALGRMDAVRFFQLVNEAEKRQAEQIQRSKYE